MIEYMLKISNVNIKINIIIFNRSFVMCLIFVIKV